MLITKSDIKKGLAILGLKIGDIVMVHSSLSSFGKVQGGADTIIDALIETVGPTGSVLMPCYSTNRRKLDDFIEEILPFDPDKTPVWTGAICECFRKRNGVIRSRDPLSSLAAIGPQAKKLIQSINCVVEMNGYVLLLGVGLQVASVMHISEAIANPPQYKQRIGADKDNGQRGKLRNFAVLFFLRAKKIFPFLISIKNYIKNLKNKNFTGERRRIVAANGPWANFEMMENNYREAKIVRETSIGAADCKLIKSQPMVDLFAKKLKESPEKFYSYRPSSYEMYLLKTKH